MSGSPPRSSNQVRTAVRGRLAPAADRTSRSEERSDRRRGDEASAATDPRADRRRAGGPPRVGRAAQGPLVAAAGGDGARTARLRRLLDLGGIPERQLLRRRNVWRELPSPFYSPCLATNCHGYVWGPITGSAGQVSPALLILIFPLGFRLTCYYYRKAYYRSFWLSPPACARRRRRLDVTRWPRALHRARRRFPLDRPEPPPLLLLRRASSSPRILT